MATLVKARSYVRRHPGEAAADLVGLAMICLLVVAGFSLPGIL